MTLWTVAHQAPLSTGLSQKEYWSGLPCPNLGDLSDPGINLVSSVAPALEVDSLPLSQVCGYQQIVLINHEDSPWMEDFFIFFITCSSFAIRSKFIASRKEQHKLSRTWK